MRKSWHLFFVILTALCIFCSRAEASHVDISIGAKVWYNWWEPPWRDGKIFVVPFFPPLNNPVSVPLTINKFNTDHSVMFGPVLSISFLKRWSVSSVFMFWKYKFVSDGPILKKSAIHLFPNMGLEFFFLNSKYSRDIKKYDSDSTVSCSVHRYVKLFAGFKYQKYEYVEKTHFVSKSGYGPVGEADSDFENYGSAFGIALTIPLYKSLFMLYNISGGILFGSASYVYDYYLFIDSSGITPVWGQFENEEFYSYSGNTSLSFAYYIDQANITLVAGGRYQVCYYRHNRKMRGFLDLNGKYDHFYGVSFTAIYTFRIGKKKKIEI